MQGGGRQVVALEWCRTGARIWRHGDPIGALLAFGRAVRSVPPEVAPRLQLIIGLLELQTNERRGLRAVRSSARGPDRGVAIEALAVLEFLASEPDFKPTPRCSLVNDDDIADLDRLVLRVAAASGVTFETAAPTSAVASQPLRRKRLLSNATIQTMVAIAFVGAIAAVETVLLDTIGTGSSGFNVLNGWPVLAVFVAVMVGSEWYRMLLRRTVGRRHIGRVVKSPPEYENFVLYLRSFKQDERRGAGGHPMVVPHWSTVDGHSTFVSYSSYGAEEDLVGAVRGLGRVLAIDQPPHFGPPDGAERLHLLTPDWKGEVRELMQRSRLVVIALDPTPSVLWEFVEANALVAPRRLLLVVTDRGSYEGFRDKAVTELHERGLVRPELPPHLAPRKPLPVPYFDGLVTYDNKWTPTVHVLDAVQPADLPAARIRAGVAPFLERLHTFESSLPAEDRPDHRITLRPRYGSLPGSIRLGFAVATIGLALFLVATNGIWTQKIQDWLLPLAIGVAIFVRQLWRERALPAVRRRGT